MMIMILILIYLSLIKTTKATSFINKGLTIGKTYFYKVDAEVLSGVETGSPESLRSAMSALRNPKAHSNNEIITAEEAYRRLATASMLMYAIDEAVKYSGINER